MSDRRHVLPGSPHKILDNESQAELLFNKLGYYLRDPGTPGYLASTS